MYDGFQGIAADEQAINLTLYTDAYVIRGRMSTRQRRVTDILNEAEHDFIVLSDVVLDEYGSREVAVRAEYAQINLASVLFAVADTRVDPTPELRTPKVPEQAMVLIPPFRIVGRIHLLPERDLREALSELTGRFVPVTDAVYWSESVGEARQTAAIVAFNHARAQILAPHREVDPWEGLDRSVGRAGEPQPDALGVVPSGVPSTSVAAGTQDSWANVLGAEPPGGAPQAPAADPWRDTNAGGAPQAPAADPWRDMPAAPAGPAGAVGPEDAPPPPGNPWGGPGGDPWGAGRPRREDETIG
jgi:hypothetical protein